MRWFKHFTDSLDDPFIQELIDRFGHFGYFVWFATIEIICKESKQNLTGKISVSPTYLRRKFRSSLVKVRQVLEFCQTSAKVSCTFSETKWELYFPKIAELKDNYTKDLQASCKELAPYKDKDKDKDKDKEKKKKVIKKILTPSKPELVSDQIWDDFLAVRKRKNAELTLTAWNGIVKEAEKAGISIEEALRICCERGWQGFKADWYLNLNGGGNGKSQQFYKKQHPTDKSAETLIRVGKELTELRNAGGDLENIYCVQYD